MTYDQIGIIDQALQDNILTFEVAGRPVIIVHGDCPTGVDAYVKLWVDDVFDVWQEPHPADWSLGRKAGPKRNQEMVDLGADICLAFPKGESRGTRGCAKMAKAAGIPTIVTEL